MIRLDSRSPDFGEAFKRLLGLKREISEDVDETVRGIIAGVVAGGDAALVDYTRRFDRLGQDFSAAALRITAEEVEAAVAACPAEARAALALAAERIEAYHRRQIPEDHLSTDDLGVTAGWRWTALESVGLYVPGGTASYPSSVLMNAVPARVAGVPRIVMVVPTPEGQLNPLVLAAAQLSGITEIYRVGGAQAVAALAYGTETIAPVAKVVGPGNAWVAAAKRRVFGQVGIDMIAGPSEVLILADAHANPDWTRRRNPCSSPIRTNWPRRRRRRWSAPWRPCRARESPGPAGAITARSSASGTSTRRCRWSMPSPPSISRSKRRTPTPSPGRSGTPGRSSSARTPPRRSATMSAARTTCCRPPARRGSPRASACSTS
jgi:hypothetical protein